jgi:hypothetical protein
MAMNGPELLPEWLRWVWVAVYAVIVLVHLRHALSEGGQRRAWHSGHVVMSLGMAYMFLPMRLKVVPDVAWGTVFAVFTVIILAWILRAWTDERAVNLLWTISLVHMLAMVYMFALPEATIVVLTYALVAYFGSETVAWLVGAFDDAAERRGLLPFAIGPRSPKARAAAKPLAGASPVDLRATLCAMAAGMAYMFFAMQVGM